MNRKAAFYVGLLALGLLAPLPVLAAAFDCSRATIPTDFVICSDPQLLDANRRLGEAWDRARAAGDPAARPTLLNEQRAWIKRMAASCGLPARGKPSAETISAARDCVGQTILERIDRLRPLSAGPGAIAVDADQDDDGALMTFARIQSNLERVAAGQPIWSWPGGSHYRQEEGIVSAYAAYIANDIDKMDAELGRLDLSFDSRGDDRAARQIADYLAHLDGIAAPDGAAAPLFRLVRAMRKVDTAFFIENAETWFEDVPARQAHSWSPAGGGEDLPQNGLWLRLPCRTLIGRAALFQAVSDALGASSGPPTACPSDVKDFAALEGQARDPGSFLSKVPPAPQPPRRRPPRQEAKRSAGDWTIKDAIAHMGDAPDRAEPIIAEAAMRSDAGKLDYALFLHAIRKPTPQRDEKIRHLLAIIEDQDDDEVGYDGGDGAIIAAIVKLNGTIPCAVLLARPGLIEAVVGSVTRWGPRSGCDPDAERGTADGFPIARLRRYFSAATEADGNFLGRIVGSIVRDLWADLSRRREALIAPEWLLRQPPPKVDYPYEAWGLESIRNHRVATGIKAAYDSARSALSRYYEKRGLSPKRARLAAKIGLFLSVWGADCGKAEPPPSVRALLLQGAAAAKIEALIASQGGVMDTAGKACAAFAGRDPLLHIAVGDPKALPTILNGGVDLDAQNADGKTALMVAAQENERASVAQLLSRGARVNAATSGDGLVHGARSALMYAAGNASLPLIEALLAQGADPFQTDTKGRRAIDYLLGFGPIPANPSLSAADRSKAIALLY